MKKSNSRLCGICGTGDNPTVAAENPCAFWNGKPCIPEGHYTLIRCRECGNLYVDSDVDKEYLDNLMSEVVPEMNYKKTYVNNDSVELTRREELKSNWDMIKKWRGSSKDDKLLDYGCAWGAFGNIALQDGILPYGIEMQPAAVNYCLNIWGEGHVHNSTIEEAPFHTKEFQYITSFETLEHTFDPINVLKEFINLLSDDGVVAISVPSADYFSFKYWFYRKQPIADWVRKKMPGNMVDGRVLCHFHINTFSIKSVKLMIQKAGLRVVYIKPIGWRCGRIGKLLTVVSRLLWYASNRNIAFAPSIFVVADKGDVS